MLEGKEIGERAVQFEGKPPPFKRNVQPGNAMLVRVVPARRKHQKTEDRKKQSEDAPFHCETLF
ncbi:MAG: hypothetical protein LBF61_04235 [Azoarcus sp.]|nr:hypothetical protein [Azoarcus sp.]